MRWKIRVKKKRRSSDKNAEAMHILFCALGLDEYGRAFYCFNGKEISDKLQVTHEMKLDEYIKAMTNRFSIIINGIKGYREIIPNEKLVRKMIYSLSKSWQSKKTTIIEAKYLMSLNIDELIGSLLTHESSTHKECNSDEEDNKEDKEMAKIFKSFKRFMSSKDKETKHESNKENDPIICYNCQRLRHVKYDCLRLKKGSSEPRKKAFVSIWSDEDIIDDKEDGVSNLCLMAIQEDSKHSIMEKVSASEPITKREEHRRNLEAEAVGILQSRLKRVVVRKRRCTFLPSLIQIFRDFTRSSDSVTFYTAKTIFNFPALILLTFTVRIPTPEFSLLLRIQNFSLLSLREKKMNSSTNYVCCHRNRHLIVPLLFLLISSLTQVTFMAAEGRSLSRLLEVAQGQGHQGVREGAAPAPTVRQFKFPSKHYPKAAEAANSQLYSSLLHTQEAMISQITNP
ncbi:hypothetical protein F3Y22_tig00111127pilonHSYRG00001 [Hibiscus syriacus]|uniref:CCHC-type domain-containing protein n=1 Tax=Hibiscus syriacus TaxID=106335 RepID=A0A6A2YYL9_HIBSY|nr:hypothetical protein F3Y22_tig00111127pilonHSYRG00001 [Hibiscus syriacus]